MSTCVRDDLGEVFLPKTEEKGDSIGDFLMWMLRAVYSF